MVAPGVAALDRSLRDFTKQVEKERVDLTERQLVLLHKKLHLEALRRVVLRTPVHTGRARGNWQTTIGIPAGGQRDQLDPSGGKTITKGLAQLTLLKPFSTSWITNNLPYIEVLEYGLYPNPPKFGSYVPRRRGGRRRVFRSAGGFSKQAPKGMVAVTVAELRLIFP